MSNHQIPRERWVERLNEFTKTYEGWLVSLEILSPELGAQPEAHDLPLIGVSAEGSADVNTIAISMARSASIHLTHHIHDVLQLFIEGDANGGTAAVMVESRDGTRTLLRVRGTSRATE
jgi:hypothetical protein